MTTELGRGAAQSAISVQVALDPNTLLTIDLATSKNQDAIIQLLTALSSAILACDTNNVNIIGGKLAVSSVDSLPPVSAVVTNPLVIASSALPPNASQEAGGNLASIAASLQEVAQTLRLVMDGQNLILAQLQQLALGLGAPVNY